MLRFLHVRQAVVSTSEGNVAVPILYRQARSVMALFPVERDAAAAAIADPELEPVPLVDGKAVAGVAFFDYADTSIGPYHEAAVATLVVPKALGLPRRPALDLLLPVGWRRVGMDILSLPVTTRIACAAGREIWGLPKFVTEIPISWTEQNFSAAVLDPQRGTPLCTLSGRLGKGTSLPQRGVLLYSRLNQELIVTRVDFSGIAHHVRSSELELQAGEGNHPLPALLRSLGLERARPFLVQVSPAFQARLHLGQPLGVRAAREEAASHTQRRASAPLH